MQFYKKIEHIGAGRRRIFGAAKKYKEAGLWTETRKKY